MRSPRGSLSSSDMGLPREDSPPRFVSSRSLYKTPGPGTYDANPRVLTTSKTILALGPEAYLPNEQIDAVQGKTSEELAFEDTFFSPLYVHKLYGPLSPWGSLSSPLPPINSVAARTVPAEDRRETRISWGLHNFGRGPHSG